MKNNLQFLLSNKIAFVLLATLSIASIAIYSKFDSQKSEFVKMSKLQKIEAAYELEFLKTADRKLGYIPSERLLLAQAQVNRENLERRRLRAPVGLTWTERGPNNVAGRTRTLMFDKNDNTNKKVWAGSVSGGLWYTDDITASTPNWNKVNDLFDNLTINSMAQEPASPQYIYFGTGEGWNNYDFGRGLGIWRSANSGGTWSQLSFTNNNANFHFVNKIVADADGRIYAATNTGLYKSTDHGDTWTEVIAGQHSDVEICADKSVVASQGNASTTGAIRISNFSTYGANTGNAGNWAVISPAGSYARVELAVAPSEASRIYALGVVGSACQFIWESTDKGANWTTRTIPTVHNQGQGGTFNAGQAWYNLTAAVDPNDASTLYVGGLDICRSTNAGATWSQISTWANYDGGTAPAPWPRSFVHADHHAIVFAPGSSTTAILGNDGGVYYSNTMNTPVVAEPASMPIFLPKITGYNVTQYYSADIAPTACTDGFLAGAQDNGTQKLIEAGLGGSTTVTGGDGAFSHIDQDNSNIQISAYTKNQYYYTVDNWANHVTHTVSSSVGVFINPTEYDDANNILYTSYGDGSYAAISGGMLASGSGTTLPTVTPKSGLTGEPSALKIDPNNANILWIGTSAGTLHKVTNPNAGSPTIEIKPSADFFGGYISSIDVQKGNANHILVTVSNYGNSESVRESTDGGATWVNLDQASLPDMPIRWGIFNPVNSDQIFLATELGVWTTDNINGTSTVWQSENTTLVNTRIDMLQYRSSDFTLLAATHGRGLFTAQLNKNAPLSTATIEQSVQSAQGYLGPNATVYFYSQNKGQLIAKIQNNSSHDYGCTTVSIGRGSNSSTTPVAFRDNVNTNMVMPKTVTVTPSTNNASGNYTITLYYTPAEISAWTTHTGKAWSSAVLLKCSGDVNLVTPSAPTAGGTISQVAQTGNSATGIGFITAMVTTGFSSFATGSAESVLPIELLSFTGKNTEGGNLLTWTTANEQNNKGFKVERLQPRALGDNSWESLGFVAANSKSATYAFTDYAPFPISYYRLRQIDNDGKESLSKVISLHNKQNSKLKIYPTVTSNYLIIEGVEGADYKIFNLLGQQVLNGKTGQRIDVSALAKGNYVLTVGAEQAKFVKQ